MINSEELEAIVHTPNELANVYRCSKLLRNWYEQPDLPSNYIITLLHATLFEGVEAYGKKGILPNDPGRYRIEDIRVSGEPPNFYARGLDVTFLMRDYAAELDRILQNLPTLPNSHVGSVIKDAAWSYYTFIRIHPFLDGNGRVGRMILQRILKGDGFKDILFTQEAIKPGSKKHVSSRDKHLNAMNQVDKTGNLSNLELYIAELLLDRYNAESSGIGLELRQFIDRKNYEGKTQKRGASITNIWPQFGNIDIYGNGEENQ